MKKYATENLENLFRLHDFFMNAPVPLVILMGPEHRFTFINPPYVNLIRRETADGVLGKPVREALPELKGQPFFKLLDTVYQTGEAFIGHEVPAKIRREQTGLYEDVLFDFVYQPIHDALGNVEGIMVQATDVTEKVLERQVSAEREAQLFRQWTELESIYRTAPVALSLLDATEFTFLRANQRCAEMIGCDADDILGRSALALMKDPDNLREVLERAASGESLVDLEMDGELRAAPGIHRFWTVSLTPVFDASCKVSAITIAVIETTSLKQAEARTLEGEKLVAAQLMAESFVYQIAGPLGELKTLLGIVREEIRRDEARAALDVAERELARITAVATQMVCIYGLDVASSREVVPEGIAAGR